MVTSTRKVAKSAPSSAPAPLKKTLKAATQSTAKPASRAAKTPKVEPVKAVATPATVDKAVQKKSKPEKVKVVRDSFTIPKAEYTQIAALKKRALGLGLEAKKSELIRAGLQLLSSSSDAALGKALGNVPTLKTGRPGKA